MPREPIGYGAPPRPVLPSDAGRIVNSRGKLLIAAATCALVAPCNFCYLPLRVALLVGPLVSVAAVVLSALAFNANRRFAVALLIVGALQVLFFLLVALA